MSRRYQLSESAAPVVTPAGVRLVGFVADGAGAWLIRAVDPQSDAVVWQTPFDAQLQWGPQAARFACRGGYLFGAVEDLLVCMDQRDGRMLWVSRLPKEVDRTSSRWRREGATDSLELEVIDTAAGRRVCCGISDRDDYVVMLDASDGRPVARIPADSHHRCIQGVGVAAVGDWILKVHGGQGEVLWETEARAVADAGRNLLVHAPDGTLRLADAATGQIRWKSEAPELNCLDDAATGEGTALLKSDAGAWPIALSSGPQAPGFFAKLFGKSRGIKLSGGLDEVAAASGDRYFTLGCTGDDWYLSVVDCSQGPGRVIGTQAVPGVDHVHLRTGAGGAIARIDKDDQSTLRALGPDGSIKWERELGEDLGEHFCVGGDVLAVLMRQVALLDGQTGQSRWAYTF